MRMAADHNRKIYHGLFSQSFYNPRAVSYQPSVAGNNTIGLVTGGMNNSGSIGNTTRMTLPENSSIVSNSASVMGPGTSSGNIVFVDPVHWTYEELLLLKEGLVRFANETSITKYIKIAAMLRDKTVRDVAIRCRWMSTEKIGKRRKADYVSGKKIKDRKEKMADTSSKESTFSVRQNNMPASSNTMPDTHQMNHFSEATLVDNGTRRLLHENIALLKLIAPNMQSKAQENIHLFFRTRKYYKHFK